MNILIFGVPCVGKTTIGKLLANKLNYDFYDLDEEIKKEYNCTLEQFVNTGTLNQRDIKRVNVMLKIMNKANHKVISVTVLADKCHVDKLLKEKDVYAIELQDSVENIFDRLVFSDENDNIYVDNEYKNKHKDYYLWDIKEDQKFYANVWKDIKTKIFINNRTPQEVVNEIIQLMNKL